MLTTPVLLALWPVLPSLELLSLQTSSSTSLQLWRAEYIRGVDRRDQVFLIYFCSFHLLMQYTMGSIISSQ
jgi:hypothetical protein